MYIKKVLFRAEREAGTGLRAVATIAIEAQVELVFATNIRIPGVRVIEGTEGRHVEFPKGLKFDSQQWRGFFEQEVLFRFDQWLAAKAERGDQTAFSAAA
jgi:hypothetical protein